MIFRLRYHLSQWLMVLALKVAPSPVRAGMIKVMNIGLIGISIENAMERAHDREHREHAPHLH